MSPTDLLSIVYISSAVRPFTAEGIDALLRAARERNEKHGVTGLLLYCDGNFMQLLEGSGSAVGGTYARIGRDMRHHQLIKLVEEPVPERSFSEWSMAYNRATAPDFLALSTAEWAARDPATVGRRRRLLRDFWIACSRK